MWGRVDAAGHSPPPGPEMFAGSGPHWVLVFPPLMLMRWCGCLLFSLKPSSTWLTATRIVLCVWIFRLSSQARVTSRNTGLMAALYCNFLENFASHLIFFLSILPYFHQSYFHQSLPDHSIHQESFPSHPCCVQQGQDGIV